MKRFFFLVALSFSLLAPAAFSQQFVIYPRAAQLKIGESRSFRVIDAQGHSRRPISWTVVPIGGLTTDGTDEVTVTALSAGRFRLLADVDGNVYSAEIVVLADQTRPGTVVVTPLGLQQCRVTQSVQAQPNAYHIATYEVEECPDGFYAVSRDARGDVVWRRQVTGTTRAGETSPAPDPGHIQSKAPSICDALHAGMNEEQIRAELKSQGLQNQDSVANGQHTWTIEQPSLTCKIWFDEKMIVTKTRKTLVTE